MDLWFTPERILRQKKERNESTKSSNEEDLLKTMFFEIGKKPFCFKALRFSILCSSVIQMKIQFNNF